MDCVVEAAWIRPTCIASNCPTLQSNEHRPYLIVSSSLRCLSLSFGRTSSVSRMAQFDAFVLMDALKMTVEGISVIAIFNLIQECELESYFLLSCGALDRSPTTEWSPNGKAGKAWTPRIHSPTVATTAFL